MEINKKYTGDFPINFESEDDKKRLVEILTSTFKLNGVEYLDGDICISSEYVK